jgi:hypothetical protein
MFDWGLFSPATSTSSSIWVIGISFFSSLRLQAQALSTLCACEPVKLVPADIPLNVNSFLDVNTEILKRSRSTGDNLELNNAFLTLTTKMTSGDKI